MECASKGDGALMEVDDMMTLYVRGKSKKAINEAIAEGKPVYGTNHSIFGGGGDYKLADVTEEAVIKIYDKIVSGSPYAKAYGTWKPTKKRIV